MALIFDYLEKVEKDRSNLIKGLQLVQENESFISDEAIEAVAAYFEIPVVEVEGVVSFYMPVVEKTIFSQCTAIIRR